ncbi:MAG: ScnB-like protein, partial [Pseudomonadota bacterium]
MTDDLPTARRWHDMGGLDAGPVTADEHDYAIWEKRVDALRQISSDRGYFTVDGLRRALEDMGPAAFETMTYYERWMLATCQNLIAEGVISVDELNAKMAAIRARGETYG